MKSDGRGNGKNALKKKVALKGKEENNCLRQILGGSSEEEKMQKNAVWKRKL